MCLGWLVDTAFPGTSTVLYCIHSPLHVVIQRVGDILPIAFTPCICHVSCRLSWGMSWARSWSQPSLQCGAVKPRPTQVLPPCCCATEWQGS